MRLAARVLFAIPITIFGLTCLASLERTPLSGRYALCAFMPSTYSLINFTQMASNPPLPR